MDRISNNFGLKKSNPGLICFNVVKLFILSITVNMCQLKNVPLLKSWYDSMHFNLEDVQL